MLDLAAVEAGLRRGQLAGLDVIPVEPLPGLLRAYVAREPWLEVRLVITPHSAFASPEARLPNVWRVLNSARRLS